MSNPPGPTAPRYPAAALPTPSPAGAALPPQSPRPPPQSGPAPTEGTGSPARNFTLSLEDRLRATASGPKAYMRRRRRIEDLEAEILQDLRAGGTFDAHPIPARILKKVRALNELIERHNEYFPIEANLPFDPTTGQVLELGVPWQPMRPLDIRTLIQTARSLGREP